MSDVDPYAGDATATVCAGPELDPCHGCATGAGPLGAWLLAAFALRRQKPGPPPTT